MGEDDSSDEVGIEPRRLQRQVDGESVEQGVHSLDLDRPVTIGMESPELLQCVESVAAELPDTFVDLFSNPCDLGMRRRWSREGSPYRGLGLSLGVERQNLAEQRGDRGEGPPLGEQGHARRRTRFDSRARLVDERLDGKAQELIMAGEEVPDRPHRQAGLSSDGTHGRFGNTVAHDDPPHGVGELRSSGIVVDVDRHGNTF